MGYFSNATEGELWEAENCAKCAHCKPHSGCPITDAHMLYSYELCNEQSHPGKVILDMLIPRNRGDCFNGRCAMFLRKDRFSERQIKDWEKYKAAMNAASPSSTGEKQ